MKQRVDIFAGNARLHVRDVKAPTECVTKQLCKHTHGLLFTRLDLNHGAQGGKMPGARLLAGIDQKLYGAGKVIVPADLSQDTLCKRLDAIARGVQQLRAEIAQSMLDHFNEKLIAGRPFNTLIELSAARLMDEAREFFGNAAQLKLARG